MFANIKTFLLILKQSSGTEKHHTIENSTRDSLKYTMASPMLKLSYQYVWEYPPEYKG